MREITYRRRNVKGIIIGALVGIILLAALVIFGLFRVQEVVISGNSTYSAEEIRSAVMQDGLCKNSLYLMWKYKDDSRVEESLPFLSAIEVKVLTPYKVQITVYEKTEVGYFLKGTDYIYFDRDGLIIEISKELHEGVPQVTGPVVGQAEKYQKLPIEDEGQYSVVVNLAQQLSRNDLHPKEIRFDEEQNITLYFDPVRVRLGPATDLSDKATSLKSVYPQIQSEEGVLHMETYTVDAKTITFKQGEVLEDLSEPSESTGESGGEGENGEGSSESGEGNGETENTETSAPPTYSESDGTFSTDAAGNKIYTDAAGNTTTNTGQYNYTDENGEIITDGYGYIDPYTGGYILK